MTLEQLHHSTPKDLSAEMLNAVARAEQAEANTDRVRGQLADTTVERDTARRERDHLQLVVDQVRSFHNEWGDTENADTALNLLTLWEDLLTILGPPPAQDTPADHDYGDLDAELAAAAAAAQS